MKTLPLINPEEFVTLVEPLLEASDLPGLLTRVKSNWSADQVVSLLGCEHDDARKVAALVIGLVGGRCCIGPLADQLKDPDPMVNQMAEHALWQIWFRGGTPEANHQIIRGTCAMNRRDFEHAVQHFTRAIELDPDFAEAYNQRALARYLMENYRGSIADCRRTVKRMPCHFGAWAGMGHCHALQGELYEALESYHRALAINPHLDCIRQTIDELERRLDQ